jgi:hypothetical protein
MQTQENELTQTEHTAANVVNRQKETEHPRPVSKSTGLGRAEHRPLSFTLPAIARLRFAAQAGFTLFCLYAGYRFYGYYLWMMDQSETFVARPPSVEAFLPISALLGLKRFVLTGRWDEIHPAGLTILQP